MNMTLYQIEHALLECIDFETGEINEEAYAALQIARDEKIEATALVIKNLDAEIVALKEEKKAFEERIKRAEKSRDTCKKRLTETLAGEKFSTTKVAISFRKSESLEVAENAVIPEVFLKYAEPTVNKDLLKKAVKAGNVFDGVQIIEKQNIQIK